MARYEGRHRAPSAKSAPPVPRAQTASALLSEKTPRTAASLYESAPTRHASGDAARPDDLGAHRSGSHRPVRSQQPKRKVGRPVLAGTLAIGLGGTALGYAAAVDLTNAEPAFVVGDSVAAQTVELSRTTTVDTSYRAAASVSRNERRTAIVATGLRSAAALEAKQKEEARKKAEAKRLAEEAAERERTRAQVIANARQNPQAAARLLMADRGWTSDAQFNCLVNLWNGESGWRWNAENRSSGAYGIPQSLPASKMSKFGADYRTNPITQIKWGLWYIDSVYGSPCNAYSTWQARSPHWY